MALAEYDDLYWFPSGSPAANIPARVFPLESSALAPLFTDATGATPLPNPLNTGPDGRLRFWAEQGVYWIHIDSETFRVSVGATDEAVTEQQLAQAIATHNADTTDVHGIPSTAALETQAGAQAKADAAQTAAESDAAAALNAHAGQTQNVHGIASTAVLETQAGAQAKANAARDQAVATAGQNASDALAVHAVDTTNVHGITNTAVLETTTGAQAKANAARDQAVATAATDATTKANSARDQAVATAATALSAHEADTTNVHGIPNTALIPTSAQIDAVADALTAHEEDTTDVHGIPSTLALETQTGAQAKANAAQTAAQNTAATALAAHANATTNVHGITDTAALETTTGAQTKANTARDQAVATAATALSAHEADTTNVHGITDTTLLETQAGAQAKANAAQTAAQNTAATALAAHEADTTNVHGIADTAALLTQTTGDTRYLLTTQRGAAGGVASLDSTTRVPVAQLRLYTLNVRDYGATGDGTTDDAPAIQAALNAALAAGGGWVVIPAGTYRAATLPLRIYSNTRLTLLPGATLVRAAASTLIINGDASQNLGGYTGHSNILIEGGTWDMRGTVVTGYSLCIAMGHGQNIILRDLTVKDVPGYHAMEINACKSVRILNCRFLGLIQSGDRTFTEAIQIDLAKSAAVFGGFGPYDHTCCEDVLITGCYFGASGTAGTTAWARGVGSHSATATVWHRRITVAHNVFEGLSQYAVGAYNWEESKIIGNSVNGCGAGIWVRTIDSTDTNATLTPTGTQTGASQSVRGIVVAENVIRNTGTVNEAILLNGEATGSVEMATVQANVIDTTAGGQAGIRVEYAEEYTVADNVITEAAGAGISQQNVSGGVITGNRVSWADGSGITCDTGNVVKIADNTVQSVGSNGIHILGGFDIDVLDNTIRAASQEFTGAAYGIRASTTVNGLRVVGNRVMIQGAQNDIANGLSITNTCLNVTRYGNHLEGTAATALQDDSTLPRTTPYDVIGTLDDAARPPTRWETRSRLRCGTSNTPTSGSLYLTPIWLPSHYTFTTIGFVSAGTAAATPTNQWFMLLDANRVAVARTADATTAAWAANTAKALAIAQTTAGNAASYTTTYSGLYYLGVMIAATTVPTLLGEGSISATAAAVAPGFGVTNTGMTTPPTVTAGAFTAAAFSTSASALLTYGYIATA